jgi:predicted PurR-regulated permease PerM
MNDAQEIKNIDRLIRLGLLILLVGLSMWILAPFVILLIWGIIIAVALFKSFKKAVKLLGDRRTLTAVLFSTIFLTVVIIPVILLAESSAIGFQNLERAFDEGRLTFPFPTEDVKAWPVIGPKLFELWDLASHNLREFLIKYNEQVRDLSAWLVNALTSLGLTIVQFIVSIIIAGVLLAKADLGKGAAIKFAKRLVGDRAEYFVELTAGTIRSVVQGVLGVAFIQALASAILLLIFQIPIAGLWALFVLIVAIVQLPPLLILGPIMIYIYSVQDTVPATIFTVFAILISMSDSFLKPIFMGRGLDIPMLVVLLGAIGGMIAFGILGLFVGAVVLTLSYKLLMAWMNQSGEEN